MNAHWAAGWLVAIVMAATAGGCTMRSEDNGDSGDSVADEASWDLREPLTREAVGMPEGRSVVPIWNPGGEPPVAVRLELPVGSFEAAATRLYLESDDDTVVERLTLVTAPESGEALYEQLLAEVERLGLDRQRVDGWWATGSDMFDEGATYITRVFQGDAGGLPVEVQVSNPNDGSPVLTYFFHLDGPAP